MINKIEALNYRCLRFVQQDLDNFNILVGPNASGKSTFLDVLSFMSNIVKDGPLAAVSKRASDFKELFWLRTGSCLELAVEVKIPENLRQLLENKNYQYCRYELALGINGNEEFGILSETLWLFTPSPTSTESKQLTFFPMPLTPPETILFSSTKKAGRKRLVSKTPGGNDNFYSETGKWDHAFHLGPQKCALANLPEDEKKFPISIWFKRILSKSLQVLTLNSERMRWPSPPGMPKHFHPDGSNLPWVVETLQTGDAKRFQDWIGHLQTALPDMEDIYTIERPEDRHRYLVLKYKNGLEVPSWLVSDGTLRLLALTLLAYLPEMQGIYLIEEPENGIHPEAVQTVYQSLSSVYDGQVLLATHSPILLTLAEPKQLLCFGKTDEGAVDITRGSEHPALREWRREVSLGDLFASGVLG